MYPHRMISYENLVYADDVWLLSVNNNTLTLQMTYVVDGSEYLNFT